MTVRETTALSYREVMESEYVGRKQKEVYSGLYEAGPSTGGELYYAMGWNRNPTHSNIVTRLGELREMGLVSELPKRRCSITGKLAIIWQTTNGVPRKPVKKDSTKCPTCNGKGKIIQERLF